MKTRSKKLLSLLLALVMVCSLLPTMALALGEPYTVSLTPSAETVDGGGAVTVAVNVSGTSAASFNAFYAKLSYDTTRFNYNAAGSTLNGFTASAAGGTLTITKTGANTATGEAVCALAFTAKSTAGAGSFELTSAKVDAAANALANAADAACGAAVSVTVNGPKTPPVVTPDTTDNSADNAIEFTFTDDPAWRERINSIIYTNPSINNVHIYGPGKNKNVDWETTISEGKITVGLPSSGTHYAFPIKGGTYTVTIKATGYTDCTFTQVLQEGIKEPPTLYPDGINAVPGQDITLTFGANNASWVSAISAVKVGSTTVEGYAVSADDCCLTIPASYFTAAGDYSVTVSATKYYDATVTQKLFTPADDETIITTAEQLVGFAEKVNSGYDYTGKTVKLGNDIDISSLSNWPRIGVAADIMNRTLGMFRGAFDGCGYTVTLGTVGLFDLSQGATIKNICTESESVVAYPIAIHAYSSRIEGCINNADASGAGIVNSCTADDTRYPGLDAENCGVFDCLNTGDITNGSGICTSAQNIVNCGNTGDITSTNSTLTVNGLGQAQSTISNSYNTGNVTSAMYNVAAMVARESIDNCYNTGSITTTSGGEKSDAGQIAAFNAPTVTSCYNIGSLSAPNYDPTFSKLMTDYLWMNSSRENVVVATNCFKTSDTFTAATLGDAFKEDANSINAGYPLLAWQTDSVSDTKYTVSFTTTPAAASVTVYADSSKTDTVAPTSDKVYSLREGTYIYAVSAEGFLSYEGTVRVRKNSTVEVTLYPSAQVSFVVTPSSASFELIDASGNGVSSVSSDGGRFVYSLKVGDTYNYTASASGYNTVQHDYAVAAGGGTVNIALTESSFNPGAGDQYIYGSLNTGKVDAITSGGTYYVAEDAHGIITINTSEEVTLVGRGVSESAKYEYIYIDYLCAGADLIIEDLYISNDLNDELSASMIDFNGADNSLRFKGTCCLDWDGNASGFSAIHVAKYKNSGGNLITTELTIGGYSESDTLYLYKHEQGAAIGGNGGAKGGEGLSPEYNGDITITQGRFFIKGSKQGATIGSGAVASSLSDVTPGIITIMGGEITGIQVSRGAFIGGSAGSSGGASGADVYMYGGTLSVNVDFSGSAIGGGGYDAGNDADGGTLHYYGGSIRTYVDYNAIVSDGDKNLWEAYGVTVDGVNDAVITADKINGDGAPVYSCIFDTTGIPKSAGGFIVKDGSTTIYNGGLHEYYYVNEHLKKLDQLPISHTWDNWSTRNDPNLYLYLTGEDHTLTVNGQTFTATWDATSKTFTVKDVQGNPVSGGGAPTVTDDITVTATNVPATTQTGADGSVTANAAPSQSAVNKAVADAVKAADDADTKAGVELKATGDEEADETTLTIPTQSVKDMAGNSKVAELTVTASSGSVTFDETALNSLASQASGSSIVVDVKSATEEDAKEAIAAANGLSENDVDLANSIVVDVTVSSNGKPITDYSGKLTVGVPVDGEKFAEGDSYKVVVIHSDKSVETLTGKCVKVDGKLAVQVTVKKLSTFIVSGDKAVSFTDVALDAWFYGAVAYCADKGLMDGIGNKLFNPNGTLTRAMMVTVLYRLAGEPAVAEAATFTDVTAGQWYSDAIAWAEDNKIVDGYGNGIFGPNDSITREQMATILLRYSDFKGYDLSKSNDLAAYTDAAEISSWALTAMKWANAEGLITGRTDTTLVPGGTANRAEVATILMRFCETIVK